MNSVENTVKWTPKFQKGDNIKYRGSVLSILGVEKQFGTYQIGEYTYISGQHVDAEGEKINRIGDDKQSDGSKSRRNRNSKKSKGKSRKNNLKSSRRH